jgi:hypothetical protein
MKKEEGKMKNRLARGAGEGMAVTLRYAWLRLSILKIYEV